MDPPRDPTRTPAGPDSPRSAAAQPVAAAPRVVSSDEHPALAAAGLAVLVVLRDLKEAAVVAGRVALLAGGRLVASGPPRAVPGPPALAGLHGIPRLGRPGAGLVPSLAAAASRPSAGARCR